MHPSTLAYSPPENSEYAVAAPMIDRRRFHRMRSRCEVRCDVGVDIIDIIYSTRTAPLSPTDGFLTTPVFPFPN